VLTTVLTPVHLLGRYCVKIFPEIPSRSFARKAIKREQITVNGEKVNSSKYVCTGDVISCAVDDRAPNKVFELELEVLYEDDHMAVVNKPAGM
jgi:tRNA pseudouridine65 synthase/23S rRNA pseudouridine1911/1915/1917 synthase